MVEEQGKQEAEEETAIQVQDLRSSLAMNSVRKTQLLEALRRGDVHAIAAAFYGDDKAAIDPVALHMAWYLREVRRQNVAILGSADVFVRRTPDGDLQQVIAPVRLSLGDGTLYQIPKRYEKRVRGTGEYWSYKKHQGQSYDLVPVYEHPDRALVSAEGYLRLNAVAGCSVQLPDSTIVDGDRRPNPYVRRDADGDVVQVVISVLVAGPAPTTGNLVVVQYTLDMDPRTDLLHMLAGIMKGWSVKRRATNNDDEADQLEAEEADAARAAQNASVRMMARTDYNEWRSTMDPAERVRWHWIRLHGPVGYAHDLTAPAVAGAYTKYLAIAQNAVKKAQTVARRNAMRSHPALARQAVVLDATGGATVPVVGWSTQAGGSLSAFADALNRVARGDSAGLDVIEAAERYDTERDDLQGDADLQAAPPDETTDETEPAPVVTDDTVRRNELLQRLDELVVMLTPGQLRRMGYPFRTDPTIDQVSQMLDAAREALDATVRGGGAA